MILDTFIKVLSLMIGDLYVDVIRYTDEHPVRVAASIGGVITLESVFLLIEIWQNSLIG